MQTAPWSWGWGLPWGLPCLSPASLQLSALCIPPRAGTQVPGLCSPSGPSGLRGKGGGTPGWQMLLSLSMMQKK